MRLTNDCYLITLRAAGVEHYYRDARGWIKESTRGRKFRATAEQVLNHVLPALSGVNPRVSVSVEHCDLSAAAASLLESLRSQPHAAEISAPQERTPRRPQSSRSPRR